MVYQRIADGKVISVKDGNVPYIYVGLDAGKPTPGVGDLAFTTDTSKQYICYVNGAWTLVSSPAEESYLNHLGITDNIMAFTASGSGIAVTTASTHRADLSTGTLATGGASYWANRTINPTTDYFILNIKIQNIVNNTNGLARGYCGLVEYTGDTVPSGAQVTFQWLTDNTWITFSQSTGGGSNDSLTITSLSAGDLLTIIGLKTKLHFLVNGSLVSTALNFIPNVALYPAVALAATNDAITVARQISCDYISWKVMK